MAELYRQALKRKLQTRQIVKKKLLTLLICICSTGISYGQIKVNGNIYSDKTMKNPISTVQVILKFGNKTEVYKSGRNGKFDIVTNLKKFSIEIKKKEYTSVSVKEISKDMSFDIILRKNLTVHDKDYEGSSELIMRNQERPR